MSAAQCLSLDPSPDHARPDDGANTVNERLTSKQTKPVAENDENAAFVRRVLRAYACRIANGDIESLTYMTGLADDIEP
jgi:hypothetical protein